MSSTTAPVNKVIPLSTVDGPGARSAVFLQGCNIACAYCHNPETQRLCVNCGVCVPLCPAGALSFDEDKKVQWDPAKCVNCDRCIGACPHYASPKIRWMTAAGVMDTLAPNLPFIRGITVSGGECTLYPDFLRELFTLAKDAGLTTLIDSNGMVPLASLPGLMAVTDGVMLDVKAWDPAVYKALTGAASNAAVKENLGTLAENGKLEELRVVVVPGCMDAEAVIAGIAQTLGPKLTARTRLKLIAFRPNGVRGELAQAPPAPVAELERQAALAGSAGFENVIRL
ncbi:YjjW family glycine radical enzyme activase [Ruminococcaceae bacterium OttesenSCG-928-D13]|nr:YjjW family glycine radical enzyme activase [Ruminococcaceae bacterium OttesenSCG-928-D13]